MVAACATAPPAAAEPPGGAGAALAAISSACLPASSRLSCSNSLRAAASAKAGVVARLRSNSSCSCFIRTTAGSWVVR